MKSPFLQVPKEPADSTDHLDLAETVPTTLHMLKPTTSAPPSSGPTARHMPAQGIALGHTPIRTSSPEGAPQSRGEGME